MTQTTTFGLLLRRQKELIERKNELCANQLTTSKYESASNARAITLTVLEMAFLEELFVSLKRESALVTKL